MNYAPGANFSAAPWNQKAPNCYCCGNQASGQYELTSIVKAEVWLCMDCYNDWCRKSEEEITDENPQLFNL